MNFNEVYKDVVDELQPSADFINSVMKSKEAKHMKFNKKKTLVVALASCMIFGTTVFAAGKIVGYHSWSDPSDAIVDYSEAQDAATGLGISDGIPQAFSNGYTYVSANVTNVEGVDDAGNAVAKGESLYANYDKENCSTINLFIDPIFEEQDESYAVDSKMIGDTEVYFNQATYKFVPPNYELTEEDEANLEDPHFEISYGADEVSVTKYTGVSFAKGDKYYNMFAWDSDMSVNEWYAMAEELLVK